MSAVTVTEPRPGTGRFGSSTPWRVLGVVAVTVMLHLVVLWALVRGFDASPDLSIKRRAPIEVRLLRSDPSPVAVPAPVAKVAPAPAPVPKPRAVRPAPPPVAAPPAPPPNPQASAEPVAEAPAPALVAEAVLAREEVDEPTEAVRAREEADEPTEAEPPPPVAAPPSVADAPPQPPAERLLYGVELGAPSPGRLRYQVYYGEFTDNHAVAQIDYTLETEGERYRLRTEGRAQGLTALLYSGVLSQSSSGRLGANGLKPERFSEQRGKRAERWAAIDYDSGRASFSGGQSVAWVPGTQDRLSMLLQLGLIARASPQALAAGQRLSVPELSSRSIDTVTYLSHGDATIETPGGPLRTVHLSRQDSDPGRDPKIDVWLGYDHHFAPVRIRLTDVGGRILDQLISP